MFPIYLLSTIPLNNLSQHLFPIQLSLKRDVFWKYIKTKTKILKSITKISNINKTKKSEQIFAQNLTNYNTITSVERKNKKTETKQEHTTHCWYLLLFFIIIFFIHKEFYIFRDQNKKNKLFL